MNEVFEALNDILDINQASLQKLNDNLVINFIFPLPGNKKRKYSYHLKLEMNSRKILMNNLLKKLMI